MLLNHRHTSPALACKGLQTHLPQIRNNPNLNNERSDLTARTMWNRVVDHRIAFLTTLAAKNKSASSSTLLSAASGAGLMASNVAAGRTTMDMNPSHTAHITISEGR